MHDPPSTSVSSIRAPELIGDVEALTKVLSGDGRYFEVIVRRYESALLRVAESRLGRRDAAEEVVQETFLCAYKSLHTYDSRYSFRTWIWTIALNQCRRKYKRAKRDQLVSLNHELADADAEDAKQCNPLSTAIERERSAYLERMLQKIPQSQSDAVRLRFFGGLKYQEIADAMQCSLATAKNRVRVGLSKLSAHMNELNEPTSGESACDR